MLNVRNIAGTNPRSKKYIFDACAWLAILSPSSPVTTSEQAYIDFFERIGNSTLQPKPKIIITSLILSEVINRLLHDVRFKIFCTQTGIDPIKENYKRNYRKSPQYNIDYQNICDDIKDYHTICERYPDNFGGDINFKNLVNKPNPHLDFNDLYLYLIAKKYDLSIVTDDGDFIVEDIEIITANRNLIQRARDSVVPIRATGS